MAYNTTIVFGNSTLTQVDQVSPSRTPFSIKQVVGRNLVEISIPGVKLLDWRLTITGIFSGPNRFTDRTTLENDEDLETYAYTDGLHDGQYIMIPGSLTFADVGDAPTVTEYTFTILQVQQAT